MPQQLSTLRLEHKLFIGKQLSACFSYYWSLLLSACNEYDNVLCYIVSGLTVLTPKALPKITSHLVTHSPFTSYDFTILLYPSISSRLGQKLKKISSRYHETLACRFVIRTQVLKALSRVRIHDGCEQSQVLAYVSVCWDFMERSSIPIVCNESSV